MSDVGRLAGVSHQTVSRVINGSRHVRPETRQRVLDAMRELDYRPNSVARALVTGRSNTLGVVSFDTTLYGPASTLFGIERAAHEAGYFIIVASLKALNRSSVTEAVERLRLHGVDGILVIAPQQDAAEALVGAPAEIPLVAVEAGPAGEVPVVAVDHVVGAATATEHLLELGHRTVWHVAGPRDWLEAMQRLDGWRATLEAAGAEVPEPLHGDWSAQSGYDLGRRLARRPRGDRDLRRQRPDGAGRAAGDERGRAGDPRRGQRGRIRRHPRGRVLLAAADHDPPGLRRDGDPRRAAAAADDGRRTAASGRARILVRNWS